MDDAICTSELLCNFAMGKCYVALKGCSLFTRRGGKNERGP